MGFVKRFREEQLEHGFCTDDYFTSVCADCIADAALARYVSSVGSLETCAFCDAEVVNCMQLGDLFKYMGGCIAAEWDDPLNEVGWEQGWDPNVSVLDSDELLWHLGEPLANPRLRTEFVDAFQRQWCHHDPYALAHWERLTLSWERFADLVRHRHRYLFLRRTDAQADELVPPAEMLDSIAQAIHNTPWRMLHRVPSKTKLIRARAHETGAHFSTAHTLGSAPPAKTRSNRMSPAGISMFYASESAANAIDEAAQSGGTFATYAEWRTSREMWCLDLTNATPIPSLFDHIARTARPWLRFLVEFAADLSKPAEPETSEVDYVPTQVVTEYVRDVLRVPSGERIEAIRYASALDPSENCWVVFAEPAHCASLGDDTGDASLLLVPDSITRVALPLEREL